MANTDGFINAGTDEWQRQYWAGYSAPALDPGANAWQRVERCGGPIPGYKVDWNGEVKEAAAVDWGQDNAPLNQIDAVAFNLDYTSDTAQSLREKITIEWIGVSPREQDAIYVVLPNSHIRILDKAKISVTQGPAISSIQQDGRLIRIRLGGALSMSGEDYAVVQFAEGALGFDARIETCSLPAGCTDSGGTLSGLSTLFGNIFAPSVAGSDDEVVEEADTNCCAVCDESKLVYSAVRCPRVRVDFRVCPENNEEDPDGCGKIKYGDSNLPEFPDCEEDDPDCYQTGTVDTATSTLTDILQSFVTGLGVEPGWSVKINNRSYQVLVASEQSLSLVGPIIDPGDNPVEYCLVSGDGVVQAPERSATVLSCDYLTSARAVQTDDTVPTDSGTTDPAAGTPVETNTDCPSVRIDTVLIENALMVAPARVTHPFMLKEACTCECPEETGPKNAPIYQLSWHYYGTTLPMQPMPLDGLFGALETVPAYVEGIALSTGSYCGALTVGMQTLSGPVYTLPFPVYSKNVRPVHYGMVGRINLFCESCCEATCISTFQSDALAQFVTEDIIKPKEREFKVDFFDEVYLTTVAQSFVTGTTDQSLTTLSNIADNNKNLVTTVTADTRDFITPTGLLVSNKLDAIRPLVTGINTGTPTPAVVSLTPTPGNFIAHDAGYLIVTSVGSMTVDVCTAAGAPPLSVTMFTQIDTITPPATPAVVAVPFTTDTFIKQATPLTESVNLVTTLDVFPPPTAAAVTQVNGPRELITIKTFDYADVVIKLPDPNGGAIDIEALVLDAEGDITMVTAADPGCDVRYKWINRGSEILKLTIPQNSSGPCSSPIFNKTEVPYEDLLCNNVFLAYCNHVLMPKKTGSHLRAPVYDGKPELPADNPSPMYSGVSDVFATLEVHRLERYDGVRYGPRAEAPE